MNWTRVAVVGVAVLGAALTAGRAGAAEIAVLSSTAMREILDELVPMFERASGHKVKLEFKSGVNVASAVRQGAFADLVITTGSSLDDLARDGRIVAGSRTDFVQARVGVAVRAGAPKPDISTPEAFKAALLKAGKVAYSSGPSGQHLLRVLDKLGIAAEVKAKGILPELGQRVGAIVAKGDADIGIQQVNELLPIRGIDFVGPLPDAIQTALVYSAGLAATGKERDAAKAMQAFLTSHVVAEPMKKLGMEPPR